MIFMTGDTHGDIKRLNRQSFFEQKEMTKDDYVIILGDFGMVWDWQGESHFEKYWLDWLDEKPFTTLFIDGNHENHDRLDAMDVDEWHGGKVHKVRPSVLHLMRGQVFDIEGLKVFTFGGAQSHDIRDGILEPGDPRIKRWNRNYNKLFRVRGESWWARELPSEEEMEEGRRNLEKVNWKVDWVLTHCTSSSTTALISLGDYGQDILTEYLQEIREKLTFRRWFFGHHHMDKQINTEEICLYEQIVRVN
ncbi:hypothetical protein SAMN02910369_00562 [Lachnospiraceae bacterium NE2001]|nr:hypothetical protein SAMN02910369_00562 [Lachnospiraceae bacterium NE2001]